MLQENSIMNSVQLAKWFGISISTFRVSRSNKLEELKKYCNYTILKTTKGNFKGVSITDVYCSRYGDLKLRNQFINWVEQGGLKEVADAGGDGVISYPVVVNYYCNKHNIPFDGPHYYRQEVEGRTDDNSRKLTGVLKEPNRSFETWHSLYQALKNWGRTHKVLDKFNPVDCAASSFNPTYLKRTTPEIEKVREEIYHKYFGNIKYDEIVELVETIEDTNDRDEILETRLMRKMSDKDKRRAAAEECAQAAVLYRKGYDLEEECENN